MGGRRLGDVGRVGALAAGLALIVGAAAPGPVANAVGSAHRVTALPSVSGSVPLFDMPRSTAGGFTVNVTNYSTDYEWSATTDAGQVHEGTPEGATWPLTVTGLRPGQRATVVVSADMPGLDTSAASVTGSALPASDNGQAKGTVTGRIAFTGTSTDLSPGGQRRMSRLLAHIPKGATTTRVRISVTTPKNPSTSDAKRARQRANSVERYLIGHGITGQPSIVTPAAARGGVATVTIDYTS